MSARLGRRLGGLVMLAAASFVAAGQPREAPALPVVYSADVDSIIHPVSAEYMIQTMDRADREGATLVVFTLRTPGGLESAADRKSTRLNSSHQIISYAVFCLKKKKKKKEQTSRRPSEQADTQGEEHAGK